MSATVQLLLTETSCLPNLRVAGSSLRLIPPFSVSYYRAQPRLVVFATVPLGHRHSSMASESLNSSQEDVHGREQRSQRSQRTSTPPPPGVPYATQAAAGAAAARALFPLGYREGFSQWVSYNQKVSIAA